MNKDKKYEISSGKAWRIVLISLIDDVIIIGVVILALWFFKVNLPLWAMIILGLVIAAYIYIRTWAVIPSIRRGKITGSEGMIGLTGEVVKTAEMDIVIRVHGEYWQAECREDSIEIGEEVEIVGIDRLKLEVKRKETWEP